MAKGFPVIGIGSIVFIFGLIFDLQGQSIIGPESSFMYANPNWITYGIQIMVLGITIIGVGTLLKIFNRSCIEENKKTYNTINFLKKFYSDKLIPDFFRSKSLSLFNKNIYLKNKVIESATGIDVLKRRSVGKYCYSN